MYCFLSQSINEDIASFDENEARHCLKVLRKNVGDPIYFTDGQGHRYEGTILSASKKSFEAKIESKKEDPNIFKHDVIMAVALTKQSQRFEWFLEKATELGIKRIIPFYSQHSERKKMNHDRSAKIIATAMKQSFQTRMPELGELISYKQLLKMDWSHLDQKLIAIFEGENHIIDQYNPTQSVIVVVGPEGDFSQDEIQEALSQGWKGVHLGSSRLRVETAAIYICSVLNAKAQ